ncbi:hypothetical protein LINPERPRIM_LOCUS29234 [Linum perenne]
MDSSPLSFILLLLIGVCFPPISFLFSNLHVIPDPRTNNDDDFNTKISILLVGVGSPALVVTIYHCIALGWCNRHNWGRGGGGQGNQNQHRHHQRRFVTAVRDGGSGRAQRS